MNIEKRGGFGSSTLNNKMLVVAGANRYQEFSDIHLIDYNQNYQSKKQTDCQDLTARHDMGATNIKAASYMFGGQSIRK